MPYIDANARQELQLYSGAYTTGELNYEITQLVTDYISKNGLAFVTLSECVAALECAKLELYRRIIAPYEDEKKRANGDVYPPELVRP